MKTKPLLFAFALILGVSGCKQEGYKITGKIADATLDGSHVYLSERINRVWHNLDSAIVVDRKFAFRGQKIDSVRIIQLRLIDKEGELIFTEPFILENDDMKVWVTENEVTVSGTRQNDAFNLYKREKNAFERKIDAEYERFMQLPDSMQTEAMENATQTRIEEIEAEMTQKDVEYATMAANTIIGNYIFMHSHYNFTVEQKEAIFAKMDKTTQSIPRIAELIRATKEEKRTSAGQQFVDFAMKNPSGQVVALSEYIGRTDYLLIDFWASWCGPCIKSFPQLIDFYNAHKGKRFEIIGVSLDKEEKAWKEAIRKHRLAWPHMSDLQYWDSEGARCYAISAIPSTVLIDKSGKIIGRNMPLREMKELIMESNATK